MSAGDAVDLEKHWDSLMQRPERNRGISWRNKRWTISIVGSLFAAVFLFLSRPRSGNVREVSQSFVNNDISSIYCGVIHATQDPPLSNTRIPGCAISWYTISSMWGTPNVHRIPVLCALLMVVLFAVRISMGWQLRLQPVYPRRYLRPL